MPDAGEEGMWKGKRDAIKNSWPGSKGNAKKAAGFSQ